MKFRLNFLVYVFTALLVVSCSKQQKLAETIPPPPPPPAPSIQKPVGEMLKTIPNLTKVEKLATVSHFEENYMLWFKQPIDHKDPSKGTFNQRVLLGYKSPSKPVIVDLEGYGVRSPKAGELTAHYGANQISIEHRYFNESRPETIDWNTLTTENAANDQTNIINALRTALFPNSKFITTGISKGCQTTMTHRRFFPDNVDCSVCYVGPLNFAREDERVYEFLENVGTEEERDKIEDFQVRCFKNRKALLEMMKKAGEQKNMTWEMGVEEALNYTILEYSFAYWQWGTDANTIPGPNATPEELYAHLIAVVGYSFFTEEDVDGLQAYFWTALTQQGIYGYETEPFSKFFDNGDEIYKFDWAFPEGISKDYDPKNNLEIKAYLDKDADDIIFIYGEYDTWSATAVDLVEDAKQRDLYKFVNPKGSHTTRIRSFDPATQKQIWSIIDRWIEE